MDAKIFDSNIFVNEILHFEMMAYHLLILKLFAFVFLIKPSYYLLIHNMEFCNLPNPKFLHKLLLILTYVLSFNYMWSGLIPYKSRVLSIFHHKNGPV